MRRSATSVELRKRRRAPLQFPVRIRWQRPFGMRFEVTKTMDVSSGGLLVSLTKACDPQTRVWVAFPFNPDDDALVQPETPARILRVDSEPTGGYRIALRLEAPSRAAFRAADQERRSFGRVQLALPIFVRPAGSPWPEESMTQDVSRNGVRFETSNIYAAGDIVFARIPWGEWLGAGEIEGCVVRIDSTEGGMRGRAPRKDSETGASIVLTAVAVQWTNPVRPAKATQGARPVKHSSG